MTISEIKQYFDSFKCEALTSSADNADEIQGFSSKLRNNTLESYLKNSAWQADENGETRVYLVREPENNKIVLFFSLKCGTTFTTHVLDDKFRQLNEIERDFVRMIADARLKKKDELYYEYIKRGKNIFGDEKTSLFARIAEHRFESKNETHEVNDARNIMKVDECYASIELQHFCRCDDYSLDEKVNFPLGFGLFWQKIVPIILNISSMVGCEYLYLFAADRSDNADDQRLISYYKSSLGFYELDDEGVIVLKPQYDNDCVGLLQRVEGLEAIRRDAWEEYSDHATEE